MPGYQTVLRMRRLSDLTEPQRHIILQVRLRARRWREALQFDQYGEIAGYRHSPIIGVTIGDCSFITIKACKIVVRSLPRVTISGTKERPYIETHGVGSGLGNQEIFELPEDRVLIVRLIDSGVWAEAGAARWRRGRWRRCSLDFVLSEIDTLLSLHRLANP